MGCMLLRRAFVYISEMCDLKNLSVSVSVDIICNISQRYITQIDELRTLIGLIELDGLTRMTDTLSLIV